MLYDYRYFFFSISRYLYLLVYILKKEKREEWGWIGAEKAIINASFNKSWPSLIFAKLFCSWENVRHELFFWGGRWGGGGGGFFTRLFTSLSTRYSKKKKKRQLCLLRGKWRRKKKAYEQNFQKDECGKRFEILLNEQEMQRFNWMRMVEIKILSDSKKMGWRINIREDSIRSARPFYKWMKLNNFRTKAGFGKKKIKQLFECLTEIFRHCFRFYHSIGLYIHQHSEKFTISKEIKGSIDFFQNTLTYIWVYENFTKNFQPLFIHLQSSYMIMYFNYEQ